MVMKLQYTTHHSCYINVQGPVVRSSFSLNNDERIPPFKLNGLQLCNFTKFRTLVQAVIIEFHIVLKFGL